MDASRPSLVSLEPPRQVQETPNLRIGKVGVQAESLNAGAPDFLANYSREGLVQIPSRMIDDHKNDHWPW
jgi:hypothetical protein